MATGDSEYRPREAYRKAMSCRDDPQPGDLARNPRPLGLGRRAGFISRIRARPSHKAGFIISGRAKVHSIIMKKPVIYILIAAIGLLVSCAKKDIPKPWPSNKSEELPISIISPEIAAPSRVVSMSPNLTQILFAIGCQDKLIGVDDYSVYPPKAKDLPKMGNYLDPNMEALIAAKPDLILTVKSDDKIKGMLDGVGLKYESFGNDKIADIIDSIDRIGMMLGCQRGSGWMIQSFEGKRAFVETKLKDAPKVKVALVVGRNPGKLQDIYVTGPSSFMGELLIIAGGENVFASANLPWPQVGIESIVSADPDVIIDSTLSKGATDAEYKALAKDWNALPTLRAVKNKRVIVPRDGWWQIPGAYMDSTIMLLAHWLHPEIFPDDVKDPEIAKAALEAGSK
jgi:iron complex transport system substrate-binding protein